jgi:diguanylate cyclase (GGDEF)-like protein
VNGPVGGGPHHVGGAYTRALVSFLRDELGGEGLGAVLRRAGENRPEELLLDDLSWSSYAQFRALLEAAADSLGGPQALTPVGLRLLNPSDFSLNPIVQALGSPEALYANVGAASASVCPIVQLTACEVGEREWLVTQRYTAGFEAYEEYCALQTGVQQISTVIFGFEPAHVVEEQCVCRGDEACVFRIRWVEVDEAVRHATFLENRVRTLEGRLEQFARAVTELVSSDDLKTVLAGTFDTASRAVRAPICVLALDDVPDTTDHVFFNGLSAADAQVLADDVLRPDFLAAPDQLVADVTSTRARYGRLVAVRPDGGFLPQEATRFQAYAGFVAAALDSALALEEARCQGAEARRQGDTARALLELSTALAEVTTIEDVAAKLVRAIPAVMGSDRAMVLLPDRDGKHARVAATFGYPADFDAYVTRQRLPVIERPVGSVEFKDVARLDRESVTYRLMEGVGSAASLLVPIHVDGEWVGEIVASVVSDPDRLRPIDGGDGDRDGRLRGLAAQAATAIRNARLLDQVRHQSLHDPLTGLPNRALILDRVDQMLARARRNHHAAAAMFIDLDGFKEINDTFGHAAGDELLRAVTARLKATLRPSDTVGRLGGDEFVVLVDGASLDAGPELVAERLLAVLHEPFRIIEKQAGVLSVTASIGIATGDRPSAGDLLRDADVALYQAKAAGKNRFLVFEERMQTVVHDRLLLQMDLQSALALDQFSLVYQPICQLKSGEITSVEALLRWEHPTRGQVQPNDFISLLEETGLILDVGRWVLHEACRQAVSWRKLGLPIDMAVNVSGRQLQSERFLRDVREALAFSGLDPTALIVEITESTMMTDVRATASTLAAVRELGVRIAIDDFGTGYSSLAVLRDFPVDTLKIDRAFVAGLGDTAEAAALIHTLIQLGKTLGLRTLAEGIEDAVQYAQLESEQCESGQGFLIARPMPARELEAFLSASAARTPGTSRTAS